MLNPGIRASPLLASEFSLFEVKLADKKLAFGCQENRAIVARVPVTVRVTSPTAKPTGQKRQDQEPHPQPP